ncbi:hypothetical protein D3C80_680230 [compost metagenome]
MELSIWAQVPASCQAVNHHKVCQVDSQHLLNHRGVIPDPVVHYNRDFLFNVVLEKLGYTLNVVRVITSNGELPRPSAIHVTELVAHNVHLGDAMKQIVGFEVSYRSLAPVCDVLHFLS